MRKAIRRTVLLLIGMSALVFVEASYPARAAQASIADAVGGSG